MTQATISIPFEFDTTNIDPFVGGAGGYLEAGTYAMSITAMEVKENGNKASGHNLRLEYTVFDGEFKGRKVFDNLNLWHTTSDAAVEIAFKQLSSIAHAVGVLTGEDLGVLAFKPMWVEVEVEPGTEDSVNPNTGEPVKGRKPSNRIVRRDPYETQASAVPASAPPAPAAAKASPPASPPAAATAAPAATAKASPPAAAAAPAAAATPAASAPAAGGAVPPWQRKA